MNADRPPLFNTDSGLGEAPPAEYSGGTNHLFVLRLFWKGPAASATVDLG